MILLKYKLYLKQNMGEGSSWKEEKDIIPAHIFKEEKMLTWLMLKGKLKYVNIFGSVFEQKVIQIG